MSLGGPHQHCGPPQGGPEPVRVGVRASEGRHRDLSVGAIVLLLPDGRRGWVVGAFGREGVSDPFRQLSFHDSDAVGTRVKVQERKRPAVQLRGTEWLRGTHWPPAVLGRDVTLATASRKAVQPQSFHPQGATAAVGAGDPFLVVLAAGGHPGCDHGSPPGAETSQTLSRQRPGLWGGP